MRIYKDADTDDVEAPIANGATVTISQWGQEKIYVYQEGLKYSLPLVLRAVCKELEPMRDPEELFKELSPGGQ